MQLTSVFVLACLTGSQAVLADGLRYSCPKYTGNANITSSSGGPDGNKYYCFYYFGTESYQQCVYNVSYVYDHFLSYPLTHRASWKVSSS